MGSQVLVLYMEGGAFDQSGSSTRVFYVHMVKTYLTFRINQVRAIHWKKVT